MPSSPPPSTCVTRATHVLVADDDAPSRCFLGEALRQLGAQVTMSADGGSALELAGREAFDLLLLDCRMPGMGALDVLTRLRRNTQALSAWTPAVASSAELDAAEQRHLLEAGFHAVLLKPCTLADLRGMLKQVAMIHQPLPLLDDALALKTSGTPGNVLALRKLFRHELLTVHGELDQLSTDAEAFETRLHKLRSSCGFCGATSLSEQITLLQSHLKLAHRGSMLPLEALRRSLLQTIEALEVT